MNPIIPGIGSGQDSLFSQQKDREKLKIKSALKMLKMNSPDSVAIAKNILERINVVIDSLNQLYELQQKTGSKGRNKAFVQQAKELQEKATARLEEELKKH